MTTRPLDDPAQLLRLRRLREERAWRERVQARTRRDAAHAQVLRRRDELAGFDRDLAALLRTLASAEASVLLRSAPYASARRDDLAYNRERCEYDLIDDEEALATAERLFDEATQHWHAARTRSDAASSLLQRMRRDAARAAEQRFEREAPTHHRPLLSGARP